MITTLLVTLAIAAHGDPLRCPVMGGPANHKLPASDYNGVRYFYCCPGCKEPFEKDPQKAIAASRKKGHAVGVFLFDPVSGMRLEHDKSIKEHSDFGGTRFLFSSQANKAMFDQAPAKYGALPKKEALYCPVGKEAVPSYAKASGYVDHAGVRYYMCCAGCEGKFSKEPKKYAMAAATFVNTPGVANDAQQHHAPPRAKAQGDDEVPSVKVGKYLIELRPPDDGVRGRWTSGCGLLGSTKKDLECGRARGRRQRGGFGRRDDAEHAGCYKQPNIT